MNDLTAQDQIYPRIIKYLKRLFVELETIQAQLKTGELKIIKGELIPTGKKLTGRPLKNISELLPEDIENIEIRVFSAEFPTDDAVIIYQKNTTPENRLTLLIHIATLEKNVTPSDLMDLLGVTNIFLIKRLKEMINTNDKQLAQRFLAMAFGLKFPNPEIRVRKATQQNFYNFGSKREALKAVKKQLKEMGDFENN